MLWDTLRGGSKEEKEFRISSSYKRHMEAVWIFKRDWLLPISFIWSLLEVLLWLEKQIAPSYPQFPNIANKVMAVLGTILSIGPTWKLALIQVLEKADIFNSSILPTWKKAWCSEHPVLLKNSDSLPTITSKVPSLHEKGLWQYSENPHRVSNSSHDWDTAVILFSSLPPDVTLKCCISCLQGMKSRILWVCLLI